MTTPDQWAAIQWALDKDQGDTLPYEAALTDGKAALQSLESHGTYRAPRGKRCYAPLGTAYIAPFGFVLSGVGDFTMCCWVKQVAAVNYAMLFSATGDNQLELRFDQTTRQLEVNGTGGNLIGATVQDLDRWYHCAATFRESDNQTTLYVDGVQDGQGTVAVNRGWSMQALHRNSGAFVPNGYVRDMRIISGLVTDFSGIMAGQVHGGELVLFHCNEEDGLTAFDSSGNGNHGDITNATLSTFHATDDDITGNVANSLGHTNNAGVIVPRDESNPTLDVQGGALQYTGNAPLPIVSETPTFDAGGNAYVDIGDTTWLDAGYAGDWACSFWYKPTTAQTNNGIVARRDNSVSASFPWVFQLTASSKLRAQISGTATIDSTTLITDTTKWYHVCFSTDKSGNRSTLFIDNVAEVDVGGGGALGGDDGHPIWIGTYYSGGFGADGQIRNVKFFARALTDANVQFLFDGTGDDPGTPEGDYPLCEGDGRTIYNVSQNASHGTIVGGTLAVIWQNRTDTSRDHGIEYGGRIGASSEFVPGLLDGTSAADGNPITLLAKQFGNPYSRINFDAWAAPELGSINYPALSPPGELLRGTAPVDTKFRSEQVELGYWGNFLADRNVDIGQFFAITPTTSITLCAWVYLNSYQTFGQVWSDGQDGVELRFRSAGGNLEFRYGGISVYTSPAVELNKWTHIAGTYDHSTGDLKTWINAGEIANGNVAGTTYDSSTWRLGSRGGSYRLDGSIADARAYNVLKTPAELAAIMQGEDDAAGLLAQYRFTDQSGTTVSDSSGNGNDGTVTIESGFWGAGYRDGQPFTDGDNRLFTTPASLTGNDLTDAISYINRGGVAPSPPVNTVAPAVTGTTEVGETLTTTDGTWTGSPTPTYTYQWQHGDAANGSDMINIAGATANTYVLQGADTSKYVRCVVTGTNSEGNSAANSNIVGPITSAPVTSPPVNTVPPVVTGTTTTGETLTTTDGTWTGDPTPTYTYQWNQIDRYLDFPGSGSVEIPHSTDFNWSVNNAFTYEAVWSDEDTGIRRYILDKQQAGNTGWYLNVSATNTIVVSLPDGVAWNEYDTGTTSPATKTHVVVTYDGANIRVYLDGVEDSVTPATDTLADSTTSLFIGQFRGGSDYFMGNMHRVRLYNVAISASNVKYLYDGAGANPGTANLMGEWLFNEASGATVTDTSGNGNDGTITGVTRAQIENPIAGATSSTYVLQVTDEDWEILCTVTGTNSEGNADADSNIVGPVTAPYTPPSFVHAWAANSTQIVQTLGS